jgi:hypothetical protein
MDTRKIRVAFCKNRTGWRNWFVRWWTGSDVVHAEIVLPDNSIIGISPEDTGRVRRTQADFSNPEDGWEFINLEITQQQFKVLLCFFEMTHGMKYDWFGMIMSHVTPFYIKHDKKWYCSQWIACALTYASIHPLFYNKINPGKLYDILKVRVCDVGSGKSC